jgi:hypothetical protein
MVFLSWCVAFIGEDCEDQVVDFRNEFISNHVLTRSAECRRSDLLEDVVSHDSTHCIPKFSFIHHGAECETPDQPTWELANDMASQYMIHRILRFWAGNPRNYILRQFTFQPIQFSPSISKQIPHIEASREQEPSLYRSYLPISLWEALTHLPQCTQLKGWNGPGGRIKVFEDRRWCVTVEER